MKIPSSSTAGESSWSVLSEAVGYEGEEGGEGAGETEGEFDAEEEEAERE